MQASLLLVHPNDLETFILEAQTAEDVLMSPLIQQSLYLGETWDILNQAFQLTNQQAKNSLAFILQAEHLLSERIHQANSVRYNTVVRVSEIQKSLQDVSTDEIKKSYQFIVVQTVPEVLTEELRLAELKLIYSQLQDFYQEAVHHNWAVVSVIQEKIQPEKLI